MNNVERMWHLARRNHRLRLTVEEAQEGVDVFSEEGAPRPSIAEMTRLSPREKRVAQLFGVPLEIVDNPAESDLAQVWAVDEPPPPVLRCGGTTWPQREPVEVKEPEMPEDPRVEQYEREYQEAVEAAHKAMASSYIGKPPPRLRGDADRMVAALRKLGWTPPGGAVEEHGLLMTGGSVQVRADYPEQERVYPLEMWIEHQKRSGAHVMRRKVIVVEDWSEVRE